jgi:hypothetical protein
MNLPKEDKVHPTGTQRAKKNFSIRFDGCARIPIGEAKIEHALVAELARASLARGKSMDD